MLYRPAPSALSPPTTTAPSRAADDPGGHGSGDQQRANARHPEERRTDQESPESAPEGAHLAPILDSVSGVVVTHDVLFGVVILADNRQLRYVEARFLKFVYRLFRVGVRVVYGDYGICIGHDGSPLVLL